LSEGVILAAASSFVYLTAFAYERGYCAHFAIPAALISPNVSTLLVAAFALGVTLLPALQFLPFTAPLFTAARDPDRRPFRYVYALLAALAAGGIVATAIYGLSLAGVFTFLAVSAFLLVLFFGPTLLFNRKVPVRDRFEAAANAQDQDPFEASKFLERWVSREQLRLALGALIALLVAHAIGGAEAQSKERFLTLTSDPDLLLLRTYGDLFIFGRVSKAGDELSDEVRLMVLSEAKELQLANRWVGPIKSSSIRPKAVAQTQSGVSAPPSTSVPASSPAPSTMAR
jgi:hypothetical protein